ncbi:MAG TPA: hypothetical protein VJS13_11115 [Pyrinomonadaceae bacterium]|nr:hypothetical protein [Pyrinomonadaceae bacterium]
MKTQVRSLLMLIVFAASTASATAQYLTAKPLPAGQESERAVEEQAYQLLDDVIAGTQTLKLPQNRSRLLIVAADLLWKHDETRARALFANAAANILELQKQTRGSIDFDRQQAAVQLRQELVLTAARRDPALAAELEQLLPAQTIATDTDLPRHKAEATLDRSDYSVTRVSGAGFAKLTYLTPQGTSNNLLNAAATAPSDMRDQLYQQAALKALAEGSADRARQIANDHLDPDMRGVVLERLAAEQRFRKGKSAQLEELRQTLELNSNRDRVDLLLQLAEATKTDNPKDSRQFLDEAYGLVTRPATNYKQLEDRREVAHALAATEPQRSLEILESGINQFNELLPAAALLSGFEVEIFSHGEMPLPGNTQLGAEVVRYGQKLAILAKSDFQSAVGAAGQFQYPEARLFARLSILQAVLNGELTREPVDR